MIKKNEELCRFCECVCKYSIEKGILRTTCDFCYGVYETVEKVAPTLTSQEANEKFQKLIPREI
jgi:hypothetical protein